MYLTQSTTKTINSCKRAFHNKQERTRNKINQPLVNKCRAELQSRLKGNIEERVLYQVSDGRIVNADLNGAANILRKSSRNFSFEGLSRGLLASPLRIKLARLLKNPLHAWRVSKVDDFFLF